jgi:hypothetical protein
MIKNCYTCKYSSKPDHIEPCKSCMAEYKKNKRKMPNWKERSEE